MWCELSLMLIWGGRNGPRDGIFFESLLESITPKQFFFLHCGMKKLKDTDWGGRQGFFSNSSESLWSCRLFPFAWHTRLTLSQPLIVKFFLVLRCLPSTSVTAQARNNPRIMTDKRTPFALSHSLASHRTESSLRSEVHVLKFRLSIAGLLGPKAAFIMSVLWDTPELKLNLVASHWSFQKWVS